MKHDVRVFEIVYQSYLRNKRTIHEFLTRPQVSCNERLTCLFKKGWMKTAWPQVWSHADAIAQIRKGIEGTKFKSSVNFSHGYLGCLWLGCFVYTGENRIQPLPKPQQHPNCLISIACTVKCYQVRNQSLEPLRKAIPGKSAIVKVKTMHQSRLHNIVPILCKVGRNSCKLVLCWKAFSTLPRIKIYLRSTIG